MQFETLAPKQVVDCDQISTENIREIFAYLPEGVTSFTLRRAGLTSLVDICCMDDLETLDLSHNRISDLIIYVEFEKLTFLNLEGNALRILRKDEFISFPNVEILHVDSNDIQIVDQESFRLMRLKHLFLSQNKITYVNERAFRYAANLELLNLSGNRLTSVHARNFYFSRKLRTLDLSNNHLTHIDECGFEPLYQLQELDLSFNNLSSVPSAALQKLTSLKSLTFDSNPVTILENGSFSRLPALERLRLDHLSELTMVLDGALDELPRLRWLSISHCKRLQYVSPNVFGRNAASLKELYLTNNGLSFLPATVTRLSSPVLEKLDFSDNPFNCECMRGSLNQAIQSKQGKVSLSSNPACHTNDSRAQSLLNGTWIKAAGTTCNPIIVPTSSSNISRPIGASVSLYCSAIDGSSNDEDRRYRPMWTLPNGRVVMPGQQSHRFEADHERLTIAFLLQDDGGRYTCSLAKAGNDSSTAIAAGNVRFVDLHVDTMTYVIVPVDVSAYYITWTWTQAPTTTPSGYKTTLNFAPVQLSRHHRPPTPPGDCRLLFKSENDQEFVHVDLPVSWERYTVNRLRPETNYSFCLVYAREDVALYKYCTTIRTEKAYVHFGVSLNYSLIALLAVSVSLICALCIARCVNKRLHIWQEEKYRGRMQESLSAQGFLSSFESLNSGSLAAAAAATAVTYENHGALDSISQNEEAETTLNENAPCSSNADGGRARLSCRKNIGTMNYDRRPPPRKQCSTVIVETHDIA